MKRFSPVVLVFAVLLFLVSCEPVLIYNKELPPIKAPADKALCVVYRPLAFTGNNFVPVYIDGKYVGGTEGNTLLTIQVEPGERHVIGDGTNKSKCKFNFQAGKIYFIRHTVVTISTRVGPATITVVTSTFKPKSGEEAMTDIEKEKGKIRWVQPNPANMKENMSEKDFNGVIKDYEKWANDPKNAADYGVERDYPGY